RADTNDACWLSLSQGFFIPADDVRDLLPPLKVTVDGSEATDSRPDFIYVSVMPRKGLAFQFVEVKYRRHLRTARSAETLSSIRSQITSLRKRWDEWYGIQDVSASFRAIRRAKLARVLRFYADKAHRHYLPTEEYGVVISEINRMI